MSSSRSSNYDYYYSEQDHVGNTSTNQIPLFPALGNPLVYYAQIPKGQECKERRRNNTNCFVKAFRWYTQAHVPQSQLGTQPPPPSSDVPSFANWLDTKYEQYLMENHNLEPCHVKIMQTSIIDADIAKEPVCEPCKNKRYMRFKSPWRRRRYKVISNDVGDVGKINKSLVYLMEPKELSRPVSDCCHPTPTSCRSDATVIKRTTGKSQSMTSVRQEREIKVMELDAISTQEGETRQGPSKHKTEKARSVEKSKKTNKSKDVSCECFEEIPQKNDMITQYEEVDMHVQDCKCGFYRMAYSNPDPKSPPPTTKQPKVVKNSSMRKPTPKTSTTVSCECYNIEPKGKEKIQECNVLCECREEVPVQPKICDNKTCGNVNRFVEEPSPTTSTPQPDTEQKHWKSLKLINGIKRTPKNNSNELHSSTSVSCQCHNEPKLEIKNHSSEENDSSTITHTYCDNRCGNQTLASHETLTVKSSKIKILQTISNGVPAQSNGNADVVVCSCPHSPNKCDEQCVKSPVADKAVQHGVNICNCCSTVSPNKKQEPIPEVPAQIESVCVTPTINSSPSSAPQELSLCMCTPNQIQGQPQAPPTETTSIHAAPQVIASPPSVLHESALCSCFPIDSGRQAMTSTTVQSKPRVRIVADAVQTSDHSICLDHESIHGYPLFLKIVCADKLNEECLCNKNVCI